MNTRGLILAAGVTWAACRPSTLPTIEPVSLWNQTNEPLPGGRLVAIAVDPGDTSIAVAASRSGGLFKTRNAGQRWYHLDSFRPNRLWDVEYDPESFRVLIATVDLDTHEPPLVGIWRSADSGATWTRPADANLPCTVAGASRQPSGRWIAFHRGGHLFVGTDCGLAVSHDHGRTWTRTTLTAGAPRVMGVAARPGPAFPNNPLDVIVDLCTENGPWRSTDAGTTFTKSVLATQTSYPIAGGGDTCFLSQSPDEVGVIFAAQKSSRDGILWESDDAGATWTMLARLGNPGRYPWVHAARLPGDVAPQFTVFFHAGADIFVARCVSTPALGLRCGMETGAQCGLAADDDGDGLVNEGCPAVGPAETACLDAVDDDGDTAVNDGCPLLRYYPAPPHDYGGMALAANGCPVYLGNDHGALKSPDCGQTWNYRHEGLLALQMYDLAGTVLPDHLDLYFATQDNFVFASNDGGTHWPNTADADPEGLWLQAPQSAPGDAGVLVTLLSCGPPCTRQSTGAHLAGVGGWPRPGDAAAPAGSNPPFVVPGSAGPQRLLEVVGNQLWVRAPNGQWSGRVPTLPPLATPQLFVSGPSADPTVYAVTDRPGPPQSHGLVRVTGLGAGTLGVRDLSAGLGDVYYWAPDENPHKNPYVVAVAPSDGRFVAVGDRIAGTVRLSVDSGETWVTNPSLGNLLTGGGQLQFHTDFHGLQAHVAKYNPATPSHLVIGTEAAGVIETCDAGLTWRTIPGSVAATAVSDFFFDTARREVFVATYGRGLWKIRDPAPPAGGRDPCWQPDPPALLGFRVVAPGGSLRVSVNVDGSLWSPEVANGGATGLHVVAPGKRRIYISISRTGGGGGVARYQRTFSPPCAGSSITMVAGQHAVCTIQVRPIPDER